MTTTATVRTHLSSQPSEQQYAAGYVAMRVAIAFAGLTMPVVVILGTAIISGEGRGSLSAYYHGPMRDFFVGALWAVGLLLISYRVTEWRTREFWISSVSGLGAIILSFFPTLRPGTAESHSCDVLVDGRQCAEIQTALKEAVCFAMHAIGTVTFLLGTMALCLTWALAARDAVAEADRHTRPQDDVTAFRRSKKLSWTSYLISVAVMASALAFWGVSALALHVPNVLLYVEIICIAAFGFSWLVKSRALLSRITEKGATRADTIERQRVVIAAAKGQESQHGDNALEPGAFSGR